MTLRTRKLSTRAGGLVLTAFALLVCRRDARSATPDPAARGLDAFVSLPDMASPGSKVSIDLRTFGFPTAVAPVALGKVKVEAVWQGGDETPRTIVTDDDGVGTLELEMPKGSSESASLMIGLGFGEHHRTRVYEVRRAPRLDVELHVESGEAAPGVSIPSWITVRDRETGAPAPNVDLVLSLLEGGVSIQRYILHTDAAGYASQVVPLPEVDEPTFGWRLQVQPTGETGNTAFADLAPREDVPAQPRLTARFEAARAPSGSKTRVMIHLAAASGEGVARAPLKYLITSDTDDEVPVGQRWAELAKSATTDDEGDLVVPYDVPSVGFATSKRITVRADVEGREREATASVEIVAKSAPSVEIVPEWGDVIPGVEQRLFVRVKDGWDKPAADADLKVDGDGLSATVRTDPRGLAEVRWKAPKDVGAARQIGPCSGGVAATITVAAASTSAPELAGAGAVPKCVLVRRDAVATLRPKRPLARAGDVVAFDVALADGAPTLGPASLSVSGRAGAGATQAWVKSASGEVRVPSTSGGLFAVRATAPRGDGPALDASAVVLVTPRVLPKLTSTIAGGRLTPGGEVEVVAKLVDEAGAPLAGAVTGVVYDKLARADEGIDPRLDTRLGLCALVGIEAADCDATLAGDASTLKLLEMSLATKTAGGVTIAGDPGKSSKEEMRQTFNTVLKNLEGAVFESASSPESLRDVLRKGPKGDDWNPEVLTLVTSVLSKPATTPGGEPFTLADLRAIDPQVEYDVVARRVTRLKMFRVLEAVRRFRNGADLDANEPVLQDPNAILRRLLGDRDDDDRFTSSALMDPWGGTMQFVKAAGATLPFLAAVPGWELHAPGPDGRIGTADDVKDPFARVVKSGTPYARAMGEDKIVDARLDMRVGDETVSKWSALLTEFTGTELTGSGQGFGSGHGRLGGSHRARAPSIRMGATSVTRDKAAYVLASPVRTDANGVARLRLQLGADETTYRVLLVALPDGAGPAASAVDVATSLPLSVRVDGGTKWIDGDEADMRVRVTNRTDAAVHATLSVEAREAAELGRGEAPSRVVDVPKRASVTIPVRVRARREGDAVLAAKIVGGGREDAIEHRVAVGPRGRRVTLARARWVTGSVAIDAWKADDITKLEGPPTLLLEGSFDATLSALTSSLETRRLGSVDAATDAVEALERLRREWERREPSLSKRAATLRDQAFGRLSALRRGGAEDEEASMLRRARFWLPENPTGADGPLLPDVAECPPEHASSPVDAVRQVESEPAPKGGGVAACWDAAASNALRAAKDEHDPVLLARLVLAFADRTHRTSLALEVAPELAKLVALAPSGEVKLSGGHAGDRAAKAIVYAALVRATALGYVAPAPADTLVGWLLVQRAPDGGFGAIASSRAVVEALTSVSGGKEAKRVIVTELDGEGEAIGRPREVVVEGATRLPLDPRTRRVDVTFASVGHAPATARGGLLVRLDQPVLRGFSFTPSARDLANPLTMEVKWPGNATTTETSSLEVRIVAKSTSTMSVMARIPLPPGASLAEPVDGVKQIGGALLVTGEAGGGGVSVPTMIPLRFALAGDFTLPESTVRATSDDGTTARALAVRLRVGGPPRGR